MNYKNLLVIIPTRSAAILLLVVGIFSLVALTLYYYAIPPKVYATGGTETVPSVPNMFGVENIDCAIRSGSCDILHGVS
jgi:hypothetical protein